MCNRYRARAFTLVELLVVISIGVVLIALMLPILANARKSVTSAQCLSNLRELGLDYKMYQADSEGKGLYFVANGVDGYGADYWTSLLAPYNSHFDEILYCPLAREIIPATTMGTAWTAWTPPWDATKHGSYGMNLWCCRNIQLNRRLHGSGWGLGFDEPEKTVSPPVKLDTDIPLFADSNWVGGWPRDTDPPPANLNLGGDGHDGDRFATNGANHLQRFCINRHGHSTNIVFLDGHASNIVLEGLWQVKWNATFNYSVVQLPYD